MGEFALWSSELTLPAGEFTEDGAAGPRVCRAAGQGGARPPAAHSRPLSLTRSHFLSLVSTLVNTRHVTVAWATQAVVANNG
eukprot:962176-Pyramimonas_sp.AAC.1